MSQISDLTSDPLLESGRWSVDNAGPNPLATAALIFVLSLAMHLPWLFVTPISGTEGHRSLTAHQMIVSNQYLIPVLYGRPYLAKPPLHYWLIVLSEWTFGANDAAWRLPSAVCGAAMCAISCLMAARWFGRWAGLISGMLGVAMIVVWGEHQVSDVDGTNRIFVTLAALFALDAIVGPSAGTSARWIWALASSVCMAAMLMIKGPGGLPIIGGLWLWIAIVAKRNKSYSWLKSPGYWLPLLLGAAALTCYIFVALHEIPRRGLSRDFGGLREAGQNMVPSTLSRYIKALFVPPLIFLYSFPLTLSLVFWRSKRVRDAVPARQRNIAGLIAGGVLISWIICFVSGMSNPRYAYVTLSILCPLGGVVAVAMSRLSGARLADSPQGWLRVTGIGVSIAFAVAGIPLTVLCLKLNQGSPKGLVAGAIVATAAGVAMCILTVIRVHNGWTWAIGLILQAAIISYPFGLYRRLDRTKSSGIHIARIIEKIVGPNAPMAVGGGITYKPEIFYYAGTRTKAFLPVEFRPDRVAPETWLFMQEFELKKVWKDALAPTGKQLQRVTQVTRGGETQYFIAWYGAPLPAEPGK